MLMYFMKPIFFLIVIYMAQVCYSSESFFFKIESEKRQEKIANGIFSTQTPYEKLEPPQATSVVLTEDKNNGGASIYEVTALIAGELKGGWKDADFGKRSYFLPAGQHAHQIRISRVDDESGKHHIISLVTMDRELALKITRDIGRLTKAESIEFFPYEVERHDVEVPKKVRRPRLRPKNSQK